MDIEDDGATFDWISPTVLAVPSEFEEAFFSKKNCRMLYSTILKLLKGKYRDGGDIVVPFNDMLVVMRNLLYQGPWTDINRLNQQVITAIVSKMIAEQEDYKFLGTLDVPAVIHYYPDRGVERINEIKLNRRKPSTLEFNLRF